MHPLLIDLPFFKLPSYGVMVAIAFGLAIYYCYRMVTKSGLAVSQDQILSIATFLIIVSMIGARVFYVVQFWPEFHNDWAAILLFTQREGFVFYGGLIFGLVYLIWYCWKYAVDFWKFMDFIMPVGFIAYGVGRLGCFLNGCCYGAVTSVPWAVIFPHHPGEWRHPTQLYEFLFGVAVFFALRYWNERYRKFPGQTFLLGLVLYAIERFCVEFLRINPVYGQFSEAQWISILILAVSGVIYYQRSKERSLLQ